MAGLLKGGLPAMVAARTPLVLSFRGVTTGFNKEWHLSRPRRSMLYMPGSNARALEKAKTLPVDSLILDLEDAVAPNAKAKAREMVAEMVKQKGFGFREVTVRVNGLNTPWGRDDVAAISSCGADMIVLPKAENEQMVMELEALMVRHGAGPNTAIGCMIETPEGVLNAREVARASERVVCLIAGTSDLTADLRARHVRSREPVLTALSLMVLAGRAAGVAVLDGVHLDLSDDEGFRQACLQGRDMGFDGKTLIHPKTVATANEVFGPDPDEVAKARKIIEAYEEASAQGLGVVTVDGKLIENLHAHGARRLVAFADAIDRLKGT